MLLIFPFGRAEIIDTCSLVREIAYLRLDQSLKRWNEDYKKRLCQNHWSGNDDEDVFLLDDVES